MVKRVCPICGKEYDLGYNGVAEGCDRCLGIQRDKNGYCWYPGDTEHTYQPNNGDPAFTVTRAEAFA